MDEYELIDLKDGLWVIREADKKQYYFLVGTGKALLFDTGYHLRDIRSIVRSVTELPILVLLTHADVDHIACVGQFDRLLMHPAECANFHRLVKGNLPIDPVWDGDVISLGGRDVKVIHNPGHTAGHCVGLDVQGRRLIGGDSVTDTKLYMYGAGERDALAHLHGLQRLEQMKDQFDLIYPVHGTSPRTPAALSKLIAGLQKLQDGNVTWENRMNYDGPIRVCSIGECEVWCGRKP